MQSLETAFREIDARANPVDSAAASNWPLWHPFGYEYAESSRWNCLERLYIRLFGMVDLPTRMRARLVKKTLRDIPWSTMLDFGSGTGAYSLYFSRSPRVRVWGVDIHQIRIVEGLELNRKLERDRLDFVCCSSILETNRFQPNSMDVVLAVEVLQYLFDVRAGFRDIHEVLKPGGYLIAHVPLLGYRRRRETILFDIDTLNRLIADSGLELISLNRVFGKTASLLSGIYSYCGRSRLVTAILFPLLLLVSLPFGGKCTNGSYCMAIARKPL